MDIQVLGIKIRVLGGAEFIYGGFMIKITCFGPFWTVLEHFQENGRPEHIRWNATQRNTPKEAYR